MSCVVHCRLCFSDNYIPLTLLCVVPFSLTVKCRCVFSKRFIIFLVDFFFFVGTLSLVWRVGDEYVNAVLHFVIVLLIKRYLSKL